MACFGVAGLVTVKVAVIVSLEPSGYVTTTGTVYSPAAVPFGGVKSREPSELTFTQSGASGPAVKVLPAGGREPLEFKGAGSDAALPATTVVG